jgi:hypothetical protein
MKQKEKINTMISSGNNLITSMQNSNFNNKVEI